jgi:RHS repeat-associated protein
MTGKLPALFRTRGAGARRSSWGRAAALAAAIPLVTAMSAPVPAAAGRPAGPAPQAQRPVPVTAVPVRKVAVPAMHAWHRPAVSWPAAGRATVTLAPSASVRSAAPSASAPAAPSASAPAAPSASAPAARGAALGTAGPSAGSVRAGRLPVWVGPATAVRGGQAGLAAPARLTVTMASRQAAAKAGVTGVVFAVGGAGGATAAPVHLSLDYSSFAYAYGGDYAARLRLVELPACALTTPQRPACRVQTPLASADNVKAAELGANVAVPAAASPSAAAGPGVVFAATSGPSGSGGDFTATPLSEAGTWSAGDSNGAFQYQYPISVPPVPSAMTPQVSLGYDSQAVDGLTSSTNDQASWIGDGWDYSPGYVEREYQPCSQNAAPNNTGDECWSGNDTVTLSLNGLDTTLVQDSSTGAWHPEDDNGEKVSYLTNTTNGTNDGGYWVVTAPNGDSYYFGLNQLPGYASGDTATNSAWTVPVFATASGQPCYKSTFASSYCNQAWRWNLDYVTDPHGDAAAYFYNTETNYYARDKGTTGTAAYTQAGALSKIEYGFRAGTVYSSTPAAEVNFTAGTSRTDIPSDLSCSSGATCNVQSPTFWSKYQLTSITTQALEGSTLKNVDTWTLSQTYPSTGDTTTPASMWLSSITRKGQDGTAVSLPAVTFSGTPLPNRVETSADLTDGYSIITRLRLTTITNETGGVISVNYLAPSGGCTSGNFPAPDANTLLCYPDYWSPPGTTSPVLDWFNKYVVNSVSQQDTTGHALPVVTSYSYAGAAWHYDDDSLTRSKDRTWDEWRGFRTVTTETGAAPDPVTETVDTYFQGMDGDYQASGPASSVSLKSTPGDVVTDSDQYAGMPFESIVYDGAGGSEVSDTITIPWSSAATATQSQPSPLPALTARFTGPQETKVYTVLASGGTRQSDTTDTYDSYGRVTSVSSVPDTSQPSESTCTTTSYASNTSTWLMDLPEEVHVVSVPCTTTPVLPADAVSDTLNFYDGATTLAADTPTKGNLTETEQATSYSGSTPVYKVESKDTFDEYGRVLTDTDADGSTNTTAFTPPTGAEPTSVSVTDPMGMVSTTTYDPARELPLTATTAAGWQTAEQYDSLGRLTSVWTPGHATTGAAEYTYGYDVRNNGPSVVTTNTLEPSGTYQTAETLYDSLGRARETQAGTPDGSRDITDTIYNSDGWPTLTSNLYNTTGAPGTTLVAAPSDQVPSQVGDVYDGDGRVIKQISYSLGSETFETDTSYGGDYTTVVPPQGGTAQTTQTNGLGLTSAVYQYHAGVPASPADPASDYDATDYAYTPAGKLATITDAAGNSWSYKYDLVGDEVSETDPDAGTTTSTYDPAGQLMSVTDARGKAISYTYDADGRKTAEYDTTGGAGQTGSDELASWTYDTLAKGQLTSSTSYVGGTGGSAYTQQVLGYNGYGLPTGEETIIPSAQGALAGTYASTYTYDNIGQLTKYTDGAAGGLPAETVGYGYDNVGDPTSVTGTWAYVDSLSYNELGQPLEYQFGSSSEPAQLNDSYDEATNQLSEAQTSVGTSPTIVDDTKYSYDDVGNVKAEADVPSGGPADVQCFQYDYLGRLTQAWAQGGSGCASTPSASAEGGAAPYWESYSYDVAGNLTSQTSTTPSGAVTSTTDAYPAAGSAQPHAVQTQQTSSAVYGTQTTSFGYDADGDTTSITAPGSTQNLSWNDQGQLSSVTTTGLNAGTSSYIYDADGDLLLQSDPGSVTLYLPGEQLVLSTASGTVTGTRFYSLGGVVVAARTSAGAVYYLVGDEQGTDLLVIDASDLAVTRRYYDPYGQPLGTPPGSWPGDRGFVGGTTDPATGLVNLGAREYDPGTSHFISPDPLLDPQNPQDLDPYAYATDNPSTDSDPSGEMPCDGSVCGSFQYLERHSSAIARADYTPSYYDPVIYDYFYFQPALSQRVVTHVAPEANHGVVLTRMFIMGKSAAFGQLLGDNRGFSVLPDVSYRIAVAWNTATGKVVTTISPSKAPVDYPVLNCNMHTERACIPTIRQAVHYIPARPIKPGGANDVTASLHGGTLSVNYTGLNSKLFCCEVNGDVNINVGNDVRTTVHYVGDAYPSMEVIQYRREQAPVVLAQRTQADGGLSALATFHQVTDTWVNGTLRSSSNTGVLTWWGDFKRAF